MTSQLIPSEFLYMWEKFLFLFYQCTLVDGRWKIPTWVTAKNVVPLTSFTGIRFWFYYGAKLNIFTKFSLMSMCSLLPKKITKILLRLKKNLVSSVRVLVHCSPHGYVRAFYWKIALSLLTSAGPYVQIQTVFIGYRAHIGLPEKSPLGIKRGSVGLLGILLSTVLGAGVSAAQKLLSCYQKNKAAFYYRSIIRWMKNW